jgi:hypothetical protein
MKTRIAYSELPDGWEWGHNYPPWLVEGDPPTNAIIVTSGFVPAINVMVDGGSYQMSLDMSEFVASDQAFVYQVLGVTPLNNGT